MYGGGIDLHYVEKVEKDLTKESNKKGGEAILTLAGGLISLVALLVVDEED